MTTVIASAASYPLWQRQSTRLFVADNPSVVAPAQHYVALRELYLIHVLPLQMLIPNSAGSDSTPSYTPVSEKMRALIVDDDRTLREGCASVLRAEGINVEVTGRGEEAIQMIHRSRFDIMFVDVYLEPVSGIDVLKAVMATSPSTLVVLMTGNPSVDSSIEAMRIGAWDYLSKPYSGTQLQLLVGRAAHAVSVRRERETPVGNEAFAVGANGSQLLGTSTAFR